MHRNPAVDGRDTKKGMRQVPRGLACRARPAFPLGPPTSFAPSERSEHGTQGEHDQECDDHRDDNGHHHVGVAFAVGHLNAVRALIRYLSGCISSVCQDPHPSIKLNANSALKYVVRRQCGSGP